jgi:uncharacterized membrane protein YqaE (UPF0057 family)
MAALCLEVPVVYSLLAILCPPAAVLAIAKPSRAAVNMLLTLLLYLPGLFHALSVVDKHKTQRRNETIMRLAARYYA